MNQMKNRRGVGVHHRKEGRKREMKGTMQRRMRRYRARGTRKTHRKRGEEGKGKGVRKMTA